MDHPGAAALDTFCMRELEAIKINGVKLEPKVLNDLLAKMDAAEGKNGAAASERRAGERHAYRRTGLLVRLSQPDITLVVASRNLSVSGFSFLYRQMLYPGTACTVELAENGAAPERQHPLRFDMKGAVVSCRHVQGMVHEIGVRFEEQLAEAQLARLVGNVTTRPTGDDTNT